GYQVNKAALLRDCRRANPLKALHFLLGVHWEEWSRVLYYLVFPLLYPEVGYGQFIMTPKRKRNSFFAPEFLAGNIGLEPLEELRKFKVGNESAGDLVLRLYCKTYLPTLLAQEDKMSMAHSVESRTPLCDNRLVDLALGLSHEVKLHGSQLKAIPRAAMRSVLPPALFAQPKRGFPTPFARWYRKEPLRSFLGDLLMSKGSRDRGLFKAAAMQKLLERNRRSRTDTLRDYANANCLYSASMVELWFLTFIDQKPWKQ
ncbi:MAG: asparagine synthase C-terminal domain-containing protein, partial [Chitinivibrionales bacterium]|nr:asparagine synthase C-terminal domain-containing protein [Chitinivibrionales bacterium]